MKFLKMSSFLLVVLIITAIFFLNRIDANGIYVSTEGDDQNIGNYSNPFRTLEHAINSSKPGDTIYLRKGIYYEMLLLKNYGVNQNKWLTIKPYKNEEVIIDGSKRNNESNLRAGFHLINSHYIKIENLIIRNIQGDSKDFYPAGVLIIDESSHIQLINNEIYDVANFHPDGNAHGILVYGNSKKPITDFIIKRNKLHHLTLGSSETLTVSGNAKNFLVFQNTLYKNNNIGIDIAGHYNACEIEGCIDIAREGIVAQNIVINHSSKENPAYDGDNSSAGIYIDGAQNIRVLNNFIFNNNFGISIASENSGKAAKNITVNGNVIIDSDKAGLILGGSTLENGGTENIRIMKNYFLLNDSLQGGYKEITIQENNQDVILNQNSYFVCYSTNYVNFANDSKSNILLDQNKIHIQVKKKC